ncbi:HD domain-containing protein [Fusobacterium varium]|uniref:HD domain-containing protein n=1 Tax=Fusobacterium varium TaxID=856 RepID=UPI0032C1B899
MHLYGVAQLSVILAKKRNLNQEIAIMAGMLHDIYTYKFEYSKEIDIICTAIHNHSNKERIDSEYDELLKDADVFQHCIYNPLIPVKNHELKRYNDLLMELDILFNK